MGKLVKAFNKKMRAKSQSIKAVPTVLQNPAFRFVKLKANSKIPFEKEWQTKNNYDYLEIAEYILQGGNYGVIGGYGNLRIIDADNPDFAKEIQGLLPSTFQVRTGSGGMHFYVLSDYDTNHVFINKLGELRSQKYQCVCPPSIHPNEKLYSVVNDVPIANLEADKLKQILAPFLREGNSIEQTPAKQKDNTRSGQEIREVMRLIGQGKSKEEIFEHMSDFDKWSKAPEKYKLATYSKAVGFVQKNTQEGEIKIWGETKNGGHKLLHRNVAKYILNNFGFLTIGEEKFTTYFYNDGFFKTGGTKKIASIVQDLTNGCCKKYDINEIIGHIQRQTFVERSSLNQAPPHFICLKNGVLDLIKGELLPHSPKYRYTFRLDVDFVPNQDCPKIKKFLSEILKPEDVPVIQEFFGYCLYRKYSIKKAIIAVGEPDTGKSTFLKLLVKFIGTDNTSGLSLHKIMKDRFATANLFGKLLNFYDDLSFQDIKETGIFKIATGSGFISAEKKFGECFEFLNFAKLIFATNKISAVEDSDDLAYYGRWLILFFENQFDKDNPKTDRNLVDKLCTPEEFSGLLNWAIAGLRRLLKQGAFSYSKTPEDNMLAMEKNSNSVASFVQDALVEAPGRWISKADLYFIYSQYVKDQKLGRITKERFGRKLPTKAFFVVDGRKDCKAKKSVPGWLNVGFHNTFNPFLKLIYIKNTLQYIPNNIDDLSFVLIMKNKVLKPLCSHIEEQKEGSKNGEKLPPEPPKFEAIQSQDVGKCSYCGLVALLSHKDQQGNYLCKACVGDFNKKIL